MSGDVQPRKRKDKKKKKEDIIPQSKEEPIITAVPVPTGPSDELIHVHKESRLGGNICAKIVFFILLGTIAVAVGLIITEYKGSGDVASPVDSPWSKALDGWVDDGAGDKHDDDHDIHPVASEEEHDDSDHDAIPSHGSEEHGSHEEEEEDEIVPKRSSLTESQPDEFEEIQEQPETDNKRAEEDAGLDPLGSDRGDQRSEDEPSEGEVSEDEPVAAQPRTPRSGGKQEADEDFDAVPNEEAPPPVTQRTEEDRVLDEARAHMDETPESALKILDTFISSNQKNKPSVRLALLRARTLDTLAQKNRSNKLLEQVIDNYFDLLSRPDLKDEEFTYISDRCIDRIRFRGHNPKAVEVHQKVIKKFPDDPSPRNQLAVTYLMTNSVAKAKKVLKEVLARWPKNGFALVHYGFILKTSENNVSEGVRYLQAGVDSKEPGTMDARFLFHLGDGLNRLGRPDEAMKVYELGVEEGLFRSKYQRSVYNVERLKAKPWWNPEETTHEDLFRKLEQNWEAIRDEGLAILRSPTAVFKDEAENLRDVGDWKQLELYARGRRLGNCARAPITCGLIASFPAARDCRRGQVKFSVMHPGTHVWPHCGPTNCRLRSHLGLVVPPGTAIRVGDETRTWEEGKIMVFDDSFEHEVWHNGSSFRLVLIVDVWHPELTELEKRNLPAI